MTASEKSFLVMFLRHVCFVVLAVVFINLFPSKADRYSETEKRISAFANHLTATLAADDLQVHLSGQSESDGASDRERDA